MQTRLREETLASDIILTVSSILITFVWTNASLLKSELLNYKCHQKELINYIARVLVDLERPSTTKALGRETIQDVHMFQAYPQAINLALGYHISYILQEP